MSRSFSDLFLDQPLQVSKEKLGDGIIMYTIDGGSREALEKKKNSRRCHFLSVQWLILQLPRLQISLWTCLPVLKVQLKKLLKLVNLCGPIEDPSPMSAASRFYIFDDAGLLSYSSTSGLIKLSNCCFSNWDIDSHLLSPLKVTSSNDEVSMPIKNCPNPSESSDVAGRNSVERNLMGDLSSNAPNKKVRAVIKTEEDRGSFMIMYWKVHF